MKIYPTTHKVTYWLRSDVEAAENPEAVAAKAHTAVVRTTTVVRSVNEVLQQLKKDGTIKSAHDVIVREVAVIPGV